MHYEYLQCLFRSDIKTQRALEELSDKVIIKLLQNIPRLAEYFKRTPNSKSAASTNSLHLTNQTTNKALLTCEKTKIIHARLPHFRQLTPSDFWERVITEILCRTRFMSTITSVLFIEQNNLKIIVTRLIS